MTALDSDVLVIGNAGKENQGAVTLDIDPAHNPDFVCDLRVVPWPFKDNRFRVIVAHHVIEHIDDIKSVMGEMHRICAPGGEVRIEVPYHSSWCAKDPFHKGLYNYFSFDGFIEGEKTWITGDKYSCLKKEITFHKFYRSFFLHKLFNRFPMFYEKFFCYIFPAEHFKILLSPVK
jgi:SAM-dependent methyltransferase